MHNKTLIYARDFLPFGRKLSRDERMKIEDFHLSCIDLTHELMYTLNASYIK